MARRKDSVSFKIWTEQRATDLFPSIYLHNRWSEVLLCPKYLLRHSRKEMQSAQILLFVGAILIAYQYVGDIGYIATLFSMPFALPLQPLMKKLGIRYERESRIQLSLQMDQPTEKTARIRISRIIWWILFILSTIVLVVVTLATQPIMIAYLLIGRPLLGINKLLNLVYEKTISPWNFIYLSIMHNYFNRIGMTRKKYSDKKLLKIRGKKGEIPFLAFIGLLCIVAGFILQLTE